MTLSDRSQELWKQLHEHYDFSIADEAILRRALEGYDLADQLQASAQVAGVSSKDGRALLASARDAGSVALKHWQALGFRRADVGAPQRPGRPSDMSWSQQRKRRA
jgi:hypothetical protein